MTVLPFKKPSNDPGKPPVPPMFNIPPVTLWALGGMLAVHFIFMILPPAQAEIWGYRLAFVPLRYTRAEYFDIYAFISPFTHLFLHAGWLHIAMNGLMFLAFGAAAERMLGGTRAAVLFILCGLAGAATQFAIMPATPVPMIGASGALSGLFAAVILHLQKSGAMPAGRWGIWGIAALWIGLSFFTALIGGAIGIGDVAWAAHAGGFLAGIAFMRLRYFS